MKAREARFVGHGNFGIGDGSSRTRAWKLICPRCQGIKIVALPHGDMPPDWLVKKFTKAGWYVGKKATDDLCPDCQKKQKQAAHAQVNGAIHASPELLVSGAYQRELAAMRDKMESMQRQLREQYRLAERLLALLAEGQTNDAIAEIEAQFPHLKRKPPPKPMPPSADDFDQWLGELQKRHNIERRP